MLNLEVMLYQLQRKFQTLDDIDQKVNYILKYIFTKLKIYKTLFNINIPDIPFSKIKGIKVTSLGKRRVSKEQRKKILMVILILK